MAASSSRSCFDPGRSGRPVPGCGRSSVRMEYVSSPAPEAPGRAFGRRPRDMALSLLVLLIPVALFVALFRFRGGEDVTMVDPAPAIAQARTAGAFPVLEPAGLASGWRPVNATFRRDGAVATLRLGYLTPTGGALQLIESDEPTEPLLGRELGAPVRPTGPVTI